MRTYVVEVRRDGEFWLIRVPELDRSTQALRYADVPTMAGDLIELVLDVGPGDYDVRIVHPGENDP